VNTVTERIDQAHAACDALLSLLAVRAREELAAAVAPATSLDAPVTGSHADSSVERAVLVRLEHAGEYGQVCDMLEWVARKLTRFHNRITPARTGNCCETPGCLRDGLTNWNGRCEKCGPWMSANPGFTPDQMVDHDEEGNAIGSLVDDWNATIWRDCQCSLLCCPTGCGDLAPPGRPYSSRCSRRMTCQCDPDCCPDGCTLPPAEGRTEHETCRKRQYRERLRSA
jgi:hypothetical protein